MIENLKKNLRHFKTSVEGRNLDRGRELGYSLGFEHCKSKENLLEDICLSKRLRLRLSKGLVS